MSGWFERFGYTEVADDLLIGAYPQDADDVAELQGASVTRVYNLVQDAEYDDGARDACAAALQAAGIEERRLELIDYGAILPGHMEAAVQEVLGWLADGERVYLHCRAGWQRSAAVAAGVVALRDEVGLLEALNRIRDRKPTAEPLPHQLEALATWWTQRPS